MTSSQHAFVINTKIFIINVNQQKLLCGKVIEILENAHNLRYLTLINKKKKMITRVFKLYGIITA